MKRVIPTVIFGILAGITISQAQTENVINVGTFAEDALSEWETKSFKNETDYELIGDTVPLTLKATCTDGAAALYREIFVDLTKTPILRWSWRVDGTHDNLIDATKAGDDYAGRIYLVNGGKSLLPWRVKVVNYAWANNQPKGSSWPSAYTDRSMMVAVQSGQPVDPEEWIEEERNVREDFQSLFGRDVTKIDNIAIMTDCDDSAMPSTGYYRDIRFSAD